MIKAVQKFIKNIRQTPLSPSVEETLRIIIAFVLFLFAVIAASYKDQPKRIAIPNIGQQAERTYVAEQNIDYIDPKETEEAFRQARHNVNPVLKIDVSVLEEDGDLRKKLDRYYEYIRSIIDNEELTPAQKSARLKYFEGIRISKANAEVLAEYFYHNHLDTKINNLIEYMYNHGLYDMKTAHLSLAKLTNGYTKVIIHNTAPDERRKNVPFSSLIIMTNIVLYDFIYEKTRPLRSDKILLLSDVLEHLISPNVYYDDVQTEKNRKSITRADVRKPIIIDKGHVIAYTGETITAETAAKLKAYKYYHEHWNINGLIGDFFIVALFFALTYFYFIYVHPHLLAKLKVFIMVCIVAVVMFTVIDVLYALSYSFDIINGLSWMVLLPMGVVGVLMYAACGFEVGLLSIVSVTIFGSFILMSEPADMLYPLFGGAAVVFLEQIIKKRSLFWLKAFIISGVYILLVTILGIFNRYSLEQFQLAYILGGLNGFFSVVFAFGMMPFFETVLNIITPHKLIELADLNLPLMRRLLLEAPGTYQHSVMVSNLAEAAAQAIDANSLLAKVAAYYHDIGKLKRPEYFIENQRDENAHDKFKPDKSSRLIKSHVAEGIVQARRLKLPIEIIDIIEQHHGTSMIMYFYTQALGKGRRLRKTHKKSDFQYNGPLPQTKEAAIVMLADNIEAIIRAMKKIDRDSLQSIVRKVIHIRINDGQLSDSPLTFRDVERIQRAFEHVLNGIFHTRIEYPDTNGNGRNGATETLQKHVTQKSSSHKNKKQSVKKHTTKHTTTKRTTVKQKQRTKKRK